MITEDSRVHSARREDSRFRRDLVRKILGAVTDRAYKEPPRRFAPPFPGEEGKRSLRVGGMNFPPSPRRGGYETRRSRGELVVVGEVATNDQKISQVDLFPVRRARFYNAIILADGPRQTALRPPIS